MTISVERLPLPREHLDKFREGFVPAEPGTTIAVPRPIPSGIGPACTRSEELVELVGAHRGSRDATTAMGLPFSMTTSARA